MVEYLALRHEAKLVVRFNGGPQAGHNVVLPDGRCHTFAQFGSASFQADTRTLLSRFMLIDPYAMLNEAAHLSDIGAGDVLARTCIDERCLIITPPQQVANRLRERARGADAHGTCGMGVGECVADSLASPDESLFAGEMRDPGTIVAKLRASLERKNNELRDWMSLADPLERSVLNEPSWIDTAVHIYRQVADRACLLKPRETSEMLRDSSTTVFEGAQGVLLDERFGFPPHTTWSRTTFTNADALLDEAEIDADRFRLGVTRIYPVRHGNGPFVTEDDELGRLPVELHNRDDGPQGRFRRGSLDLVMLRFAIQACEKVDAIALTCLDHLPFVKPIACDSYERGGRTFVPVPSGDLKKMAEMTAILKRVKPRFHSWPVENADRFVAAMQDELDVRIAYRSTGPTIDGKSE